jgi:hypothetical protein
MMPKNVPAIAKTKDSAFMKVEKEKSQEVREGGEENFSPSSPPSCD